MPREQAGSYTRRGLRLHSGMKMHACPVTEQPGSCTYVGAYKQDLIIACSLHPQSQCGATYQQRIRLHYPADTSPCLPRTSHTTCLCPCSLKSALYICSIPTQHDPLPLLDHPTPTPHLPNTPALVEKPKSATRTVKPRRSRHTLLSSTLPGLMSPCTMPRECK